MKKITFSILLSGLLIFSFIFASCNAEQRLPGADDPSQSTAPPTTDAYEAMLRELENRILELQQSQYISDAENQQELLRLQNLLAELKAQIPSDSQPPQDSCSDPSQDSSLESDTSGTSSALFSYVRRGDTVTITGYSGEDERVVIPTRIDGLAVTEIGDSAFRSGKIKDIVIPEGITTIGWFAFRDCTALRSVTIPSSVTGIGYSAVPSGIQSVTIYCHKDSFAQKYAQSYGLSYVFL